MKKNVSAAVLSVVALAMVVVSASIAMADTVYIPHITNGYDGWTNFLQVDNTGITAQEFTLTLYNDGAVAFEGTYSAPALGEYGPLNLTTLDGAGTATCGKITFTGSTLVFRACYQYSSGGVAEFILNGDLNTSLGFYFSSFTDNVTSKGIALSNFGQTTAFVYFYGLGSGSVLGYTPFLQPVTIAPNSRFLAGYADIFSSVSLGDLKKIIAVSNSPGLSGLVMQGNDAVSNLLFTPAVEVTDFTTDGMDSTDKTGTWTGTWHSSIYREESGSVTLYILTVNGDLFTGTMDVTNTDCGDVTEVPCSGTITDTLLTLESTYTCMGHTGTLSYTNGIILNDTINGTFVFTADIALANDAGAFTLQKAY